MVLATVLILIGMRRWPLAVTAWGAAALFIAFTAERLGSLERYVWGSVVPIMTLATLGGPRFKSRAATRARRRVRHVRHLGVHRRLRPLTRPTRTNPEPRTPNPQNEEIMSNPTFDVPNEPIVVIGAGPAGLTAAYELAKRGVTDVTILEADDIVGGISRTVERDGWRFDIGGHRFFTKVPRWRRSGTRSSPTTRLPAAPPDEPHLLQRQVLRLPAASRQRPARASAPSRRRGASCRTRWARVRPPGDTDDVRGLDGVAASAGGSTGCSSRPTPRRCGACRPRRSRPTGPRSASRTCRSAEAVRQRAAAEAAVRPPGHVADRGVPVPEARPRDDVGDVPRPRREGRAPRSRMEHRVVGVDHADGGARAVA